MNQSLNQSVNQSVNDIVYILQSGWPAGLLQDKVVAMMPDDVKAQRPSWNNPEVSPAESPADSSAATAQVPAYR